MSSILSSRGLGIVDILFAVVINITLLKFESNFQKIICKSEVLFGVKNPRG